MTESAFEPGVLRPVPGKSSFCEWKGVASYWDIVVGDQVIRNAAWSYPRPSPSFAAIAGYISLYPGKMESCTVNGEQVVAQPSDFYGGWYTPSWVDVGEKGMKGRPGTEWW